MVFFEKAQTVRPVTPRREARRGPVVELQTRGRHAVRQRRKKDKPPVLAYERQLFDYMASKPRRLAYARLRRSCLGKHHRLVVLKGARQRVPALNRLFCPYTWQRGLGRARVQSIIRALAS